MHKVFYSILILVLAFPLAAQVTLPVSFEGDSLAYDLQDFEGADASLVENPDKNGENASDTVVRSIKTVGAQFFAGAFLNLDAPIDFSEEKGISIQTWSPKADIPVRLKIENSDASSFVEIDLNTTVASAWETLTFNFSEANPDVDYVRVIVFFEFIDELPGDGTTYYFDNIRQVEVEDTGDNSIVLPITFEDDSLDYNPVGFEGADSALEDNPDQTGMNDSETVVRTTKTMGAQFFAGTTIVLSEPIDFSSEKGLSIQTWSPKVGIPVRLKIETSDGNIFLELDMNTTVASAWETLTYNFSAANPDVDYTKVTVFFEFVPDLAGDGTTYYFDNIMTAEVEVIEGSSVLLPITFEDDSLDYNPVGFEGADSALEDNPDRSGMNDSETVVRTTKTAGAQFFAGTTIVLGEPIDFSSGSEMSIQTWSPKVGIPVRLKIENSDGSVFLELDMNTTVASAWETLTYDFSNANPDVDYTKVTVFFEFITDLPGDGTTYYFDNISSDGVVSVVQLTAAEVNVFPNPAFQQVTISSPGAVIDLAELFDTGGKRISTATPRSYTHDMVLGQLPAGPYFLRVTTSEGVRMVRLMKQ